MVTHRAVKNQVYFSERHIILVFINLNPEALWAHTVVYALFQHYDTILLKCYFLIGFVDFFWYHFNITMVILDPRKVHKAYTTKE